MTCRPGSPGGRRRDRSCFRKTLHGSVEDQFNEDQFKGAQMETRRSVRKEASTGAQPR